MGQIYSQFHNIFFKKGKIKQRERERSTKLLLLEKKLRKNCYAEAYF